MSIERIRVAIFVIIEYAESDSAYKMNTESLTLRITIIVHGAFQRIFFYKPKIVSHTNTKHHIKSRLMHKIKFKSWGEPKFLTPCFHGVCVKYLSEIEKDVQLFYQDPML